MMQRHRNRQVFSLWTTFRELIVLIDLCLKLFILDERTHPSECIIDPTLKEAQGPALITYNDGVLRPSDWRALRTIHSSSKKADDGWVSHFCVRLVAS